MKLLQQAARGEYLAAFTHFCAKRYAAECEAQLFPLSHSHLSHLHSLHLFIPTLQSITSLPHYSVDEAGKSWTTAIFSPVLRFLGGGKSHFHSARIYNAISSITHVYSILSQPPHSHSSDDEKAAAEVAASAGAGGGSLTRLAQPGGAAVVGARVGLTGVAATSLSSRQGAVAGATMIGLSPRAPASSSATAAAESMAAVAAAGVEASAQAAFAAGATTTIMVAPAPPVEFEEFNPYLFIKMLPPYHTVAPPTPRIALPKKNKRMPDINLILDLDETLVHCSVDPISDADVTFPVVFNSANYQVYVRKRPHLDKFFALISGKFEVTVFTASQQVYAERLLNLLDPEGRHIHNRLYRDSCLNVDGNFLKDLNVLGRDLTKTVLVDNSPHAFGYQLDNGIPIESWFDDKTDTELLKLAAFVHTLLGQEDVRPLVRERFRLWHLVSVSGGSL